MISNRNVFEILEINPNDLEPKELAKQDLYTNPSELAFKKIKKQYLKLAFKFHPDKNKEPDAAEKFKVISCAFDLVNDAEKLALYINLYKENKLDFYDQTSYSTTTSTTSSSEKAETDTSNAIKPYSKSSDINIFVPVDFYGIDSMFDYGSNVSKYSIGLKEHEHSEKEFIPEVNLNDFIRVINNHLQNQDIQIGVTAEDAKDVVNQHKHHHPTLLVEVKVSLSRLSDGRQSEKEKWGKHILNAKDRDFFWLLQGTQIDASNIISIQLMHAKDYKNTCVFSSRMPSLDPYWPDDYIYTPAKAKALADKAHQNLIQSAEVELQHLSKHSFLSRKNIAKLEMVLAQKDDEAIRSTLGQIQNSRYERFITKLPGTSSAPASQQMESDAKNAIVPRNRKN